MFRIFKKAWAASDQHDDDPTEQDEQESSRPSRSENSLGWHDALNAETVSSSGQPPLKRRRISENHSNSPPYLTETDLGALQAAKQQDTIAVFGDRKAKDYVTAKLCEWACLQEEVRVDSGLWRRVIVYTMESDAAVELSLKAIQGIQPGLHVVGTSQLKQASDDESWLRMMEADLLIMPHPVFLEFFEAGVIAFSQISWIIVDEPKLALRHGHPLAAIVSALVAAPKDEKPRLMGTILQSRDSTQFQAEDRKLEKLLSANFFGIASVDREEALRPASGPLEVVVRFNPPSKVVETALCKHLRTFDKKERLYRKEFRAAKAVLREVGSFASDWVWRRALKSMDEDGMDLSFDEDEDEPKDSSLKEAQARQNIQKTIRNWTFTMPNLDPASRGFNVTPKVAKLVQILQCFQSDGEQFRGVVIVRRRISALAIVEVLKTVSEQLPFIRVTALTGPWSHDNATQASIVDDFESGICNLLVATKIVEDGIDIPPCTCIIRYDLFDSNISHAQSRAMANGGRCHTILMLDKNAAWGRKAIRHAASMPEDVKDWAQIVSTRKEGAVPPKGILQTTQVYHSDSDDDLQEGAQYIKNPTMSGRIYPQDSVDVIYRYLSTLPQGSKGSSILQPVFEFKSTPSGSNRCTLVFPLTAPIARIKGPACSSQMAAKRATCFEACKQLHDMGLLSYKLFPRPREVARRLRVVAVSIDQDIEQTKGSILPVLPPAPAPPSLALESQPEFLIPPQAPVTTGARCYKRKTPEFWDNAVDADREHVYPTILTVDRNHNPQKPYQPVLLITKVPLPAVDDFKLYFATMPSVTYLRPARPIALEKEKLLLLHRYTIRAMRGISNKAFDCSEDEMPFLLAPLDFGWDLELGKAVPKWPFPDVTDYIPWDLVLYAAEQHLVPLRTETLESLRDDIKDAIVQDWWSEYTKRYDCMEVRTDLNPLTPLPSLEKAGKFKTLIDFCKSKRKGFEGLVDYSQPLIEVSNLPSLINRLSPATKAFTLGPGGNVTYSAKFVIPELCCKFTIPASTMRTLSLLPSIMKRVDDALLVRELNAMYFNNEIDESALHAAITAPSAGVEFDYERLELLGDAFLKYLSSIYLFVTSPTQHEGILHIARQKIISNKALLVNADKCGLPQYIQSKPFMPKTWVPKNYSIIKTTSQLPEDKQDVAGCEVKEESVPMDLNIITPTPHADGKIESALKPNQKKGLNDDKHLWLGDKCVADVAEAIIGAAFQTGGRDLGLKVVKSLHLPLPFIESWEDFALKAKAPPPDITIPLGDNVLETVEVIVGAKFKRPHILAQALTHTSAHGNDMTSYERLEFLGDAILDFLVIQHIFDLHGRLSPGALTLLKGAMVSNSALAAISVHHGLHKYLITESGPIKKAIDMYIPDIEEKQRAEYAAADKEGRPCGQYWLELDPPKSIADIIESILGALYVSDGFDLSGAQAMYDTLLRPFYDRHISLKTLSHHPTKILFELFQSRGCQEFEITKQQDPTEIGVYRCEVVVHDVILAAGMDPTPTFAARRASFEALDALEGDSLFMDRVCDCRARAEQRKAAKRAARAQQGKQETKRIDSDEDDLDLDV